MPVVIVTDEASAKSWLQDRANTNNYDFFKVINLNKVLHGEVNTGYFFNCNFLRNKNGWVRPVTVEIGIIVNNRTNKVIYCTDLDLLDETELTVAVSSQ